MLYGRTTATFLGTSLGGLHVAYSGAHRSDAFGMAAIYSPYHRARPPLQVFMTQGIHDLDVENTRWLAGILEEKGYPLRHLETSDGHSWGNWRGVIDGM